MTDTGLIAERLFTDICAENYLRGFVFHSPKIKQPTEIEAGDVVIWVRTQLIVFEMISRDPASTGKLTSFIKRIGEKRDQLKKDYDIYSSLKHDIVLTNESGGQIVFEKDYFVKQGFVGVVLIDVGSTALKLHYGTIEKALSLNCPIHFLHYEGFKKILHEIDTVADVYFYFQDRARFLPFLFKNYPDLILNINEDFEINLLSFYKFHLNKFPEDKFDINGFFQYWEKYSEEFKEKIIARDSENEDSRIIDDIIQRILALNGPNNEEKLFAWELATLTRRQRAFKLTKKLSDAFLGLSQGNKKRFFSYFNQTTECWILFYFYYGPDTEAFKIEFENLLRLKTIFEAANNDFSYSIFGYGFRKSIIKTKSPLFDDFALAIQDVIDLGTITKQELDLASKQFGFSKSMEIEEFPEGISGT